MIVKTIPTTDTNIVLSYGGNVYTCFVPAGPAGSTFQIGSSVIVPTVETGTSFANEVDLIIDETQPSIIDERGNTYFQMIAFKENLSTTIPTRV